LLHDTACCGKLQTNDVGYFGRVASHLSDFASVVRSTTTHYVVLDFVGIGAVNGDLGVMADQVRRAIAWTYKNAASFDGDPDRLYIGGHSSGGHLCSVALVTDWKNDFGLPETALRGGLCMSGMYDMRAVRLSKRSKYVKFTDELEQAMSPQRHLDLLRTPVTITYGTYETPEFQRRRRRRHRRRLCADGLADEKLMDALNEKYVIVNLGDVPPRP
jgi:Carboxylesterase family